MESFNQLFFNADGKAYEGGKEVPTKDISIKPLDEEVFEKSVAPTKDIPGDFKKPEVVETPKTEDQPSENKEPEVKEPKNDILENIKGCWKEIVLALLIGGIIGYAIKSKS